MTALFSHLDPSREQVALWRVPSGTTVCGWCGRERRRHKDRPRISTCVDCKVYDVYAEQVEAGNDVV